MAIASGGTLGTAANSTSNSSFSLTTSGALNAGEYAIVVAVSDNTSTTDGDNSEVSSVTFGGVNMVKLGEYTNGSPGAAAGVTTSVWGLRAGRTFATSSTVTINYISNRTDKCASAWRFTVAANSTLSLTTGTTNPVTNEVNASNGFGSVAFSGLSSLQRLYFRGLGKEANSTTNITASASFTTITNTRSRNNAAAVGVWGEFRINTSTGETSNPTLAVSGDTAGVFLALEETALPASGGNMLNYLV